MKWREEFELQIEIKSADTRIRAERVVPDEGVHPGVIVVHDARGFSEHVVGVAHELARAGYAALAVDMYSRGGPAPDVTDPELLAFMRSVPDRQILSDLQAAIDFVAADPAVRGQRIGIIGYCWGGSGAFLASGHCRGLSAVVSWYGELRTEELDERHPEHPIDALDDRTCPVLAMFGELDAHVPLSHVEELRERVARNPIELELVIYPGRHHGFAHRGREYFEESGHDDGWRRIFELFDRELHPA
jgi:carboxymethylenebutenolidase